MDRPVTSNRAYETVASARRTLTGKPNMIRISTLLLLATAALAQSSTTQTQPGPHSPPGSGHVPRDSSTAHPWPMRYGDPARTGRSSFPGASTGVAVWKFRIAGTVPQFAVARDGTVYCGTVFHEEWWSNESFVYALTDTGTLEWRAKVEPYDWGFSQSVDGGPALDPEERVFMPSARGRLYQFSSAGQILWTYQGNAGATHRSSPAILADGSARHYMLGHGLVGVSSTGAEIFRNNGVFTVASSVAVAESGEMALSAVTSNEPHTFPAIHYLNADGTLRWVRTTLTGEDSTPVIGDDGTVFARYNGTTAFRPDNTTLWFNATPAASRALGRNGVLYLGSGTTVRLVDAATGVEFSSIVLPGSANEGIAIDSTDRIYLTTSNGYACAYTAGGVPVFEKKICDSFTTGPVIATSSRIVAAGKEGFTKFVYSIR